MCIQSIAAHLPLTLGDFLALWDQSFHLSCNDKLDFDLPPLKLTDFLSVRGGLPPWDYNYTSWSIHLSHMPRKWSYRTPTVCSCLLISNSHSNALGESCRDRTWTPLFQGAVHVRRGHSMQCSVERLSVGSVASSKPHSLHL